MDITFKGRHITVPERFRRHATAKLAKLEKLDQRAIRVDVEVSKENNPRQADRCTRVELTIRSRGPAIRAEAAADEMYAALDLAFAKLEGQLRRAAERRKGRRTDVPVRSVDAASAVSATRTGQAAAAGALPETAGPEEAALELAAITESVTVGRPRGRRKVNGRSRQESLVPLPAMPGAGENLDAGDRDAEDTSGLVPIQMEGDGPLVVREKFHPSGPMTIDQALLQMELVGHDFYAYHDSQCGKFSVVYRRRGYDYGVIRLVEE
ncbi:MAG TPA: ribosome-associated translation inhibitor RaiA [Trebonia sp.]|jgi:ribosomal subunit interface protein|nr:ribosome-associated translation inhibitor RaiA [Trebonia sp.]